MDADFSESYDIFTSSDDYATRYAGKVGEWMLKVQEQAVLRMLAPYPNASVLDVGGGHGQLTPALLANCNQVTVLSSAEECKKRITPWLDRIEFRVGSLTKMPCPDLSFDVVIALRLMAHMPDWAGFIRELTRVARKAVIVDYPEARSINVLSSRLFGLKKRLEPNTRRFQCLHGKELSRVFEEAGFTEADRFPQYFFPMALHRALKQPGLSSALESTARALGLTSVFGSPVIIMAIRPSDHSTI